MCSFVEVADWDASLRTIGDRFYEWETGDNDIEIDVGHCNIGDVKIVYEMTSGIICLSNQCQSGWNHRDQSACCLLMSRVLTDEFR